MEFTFGGKRILNGKVIDFKSYNLFNGPFLQAKVGSETLKMTYKDSYRILDFKNVKVESRGLGTSATSP